MDFISKDHHTTYPAISPLQANLSGKSVLITGASKGVGRATALSFARAGASHIAIGARSPLSTLTTELLSAAQKAGRTTVPKIVELDLDVTSLESVSSAATKISQEFEGSLDILINNAGALSPFLPLLETDPDAWWRDYEVNVKGTYLTTRAFIPLLQNSQLRTIINVTSVGATLLSPGASAYGTSKLAILRFAEFVNVDYGAGDRGILCFCVHPGGVKTELSLTMPDEYAVFLGDEPELPGDSLVWLTKQRREWLAGRYVSVNWDVEELEKKREVVEQAELLKVRLAVNPFDASTSSS